MVKSVEFTQSRKTWLRVAALLASMGLWTCLPAATPGDLSKYRNFQLGTDLATVAGQTGQSQSSAKVIAARPARIQELEWSPQPLGASSKPEAVRSLVFSFYDGHLYQIAVNYDRYQTEGLTADDIIDTVSEAYGTVATRPVVDKAAEGSYPFTEEAVARWEDAQYRLDLMRVSYGSVFRLVATVKRLESPVQAALLEAKRLDDQEAPQRDAARAADAAQSERARLEKIRLVNKPKFRP
jgi:hypothetical protein